MKAKRSIEKSIRFYQNLLQVRTLNFVDSQQVGGINKAATIKWMILFLLSNKADC